jgi:hypothetical protein
MVDNETFQKAVELEKSLIDLIQKSCLDSITIFGILEHIRISISKSLEKQEEKQPEHLNFHEKKKQFEERIFKLQKRALR